MKSILTGTFAAFVLGAAIASSQTPPPAGQAPAGAKPSDEQTKPAGQAEPAGQKSATAKPQTQTYRGYLRGSEASGWTIAPMTARSGASSTTGATATAGGAAPVTYKVVVADASKTDLASMADQCVEIVGMLAPESGAGGAGRTSPGGGAENPAAGAAAQSGSANRTLTVTTIKEVEGGCKQ